MIHEKSYELTHLRRSCNMTSPGQRVVKRIATALVLLFVALATLLNTGCAEEEVVECFRVGLDRYCVKIPSSTECILERVERQDRVRCTDKNDKVSYPEKFNFDDGNIWLPE